MVSFFIASGIYDHNSSPNSHFSLPHLRISCTWAENQPALVDELSLGPDPRVCFSNPSPTELSDNTQDVSEWGADLISLSLNFLIWKNK